MATYYPNATMRPVQTTKRARGDYPPAYNSLGEPWGGVYDQTAYMSGRVKDQFTVDTNPPSEFSQGYVDTMGQPGANQGTGPKMAESPGERAITEILINGGAPGPAYRGGWGSSGLGRSKPLQWEPAAPSGPAPAGDPWGGGMRGGVQTSPTPGMVTGPKQKSGAFGLFGLADRPANKPIAHTFAPVKSAGERTDVLGRDMAFLPKSVQTSDRWNTGY